MSSPVYLVDASIYIFQAHFSPGSQVSSIRGDDRSAFCGFARFLLRLLLQIEQQSQSPLVAVAFDESLFSGFRHRMYPPYKSNRVLPDENLALQLKACQTLCDALGVASYASTEYEADDIIGTLASRCRGHDSLVIVSRDKDLGQLLMGGSDVMWDPLSSRRRGRTDLYQQLGIWPEQIPCYLGVTGDAVDCIPGVPGMGPVAARALLNLYGSLDELYQNIALVGSLAIRSARRYAELLDEFQEQALLSRQLAAIECDAEGQDAFVSAKQVDLLLSEFSQQRVQELLHMMQLSERSQTSLLSLLEKLERSRSSHHADHRC